MCRCQMHLSGVLFMQRLHYVVPLPAASLADLVASAPAGTCLVAGFPEHPHKGSVGTGNGRQIVKNLVHVE
jgi:hypothetical protein